MILNPAILALMMGSILLSLASIYAAGAGIFVAGHWDLASASPRQIRLERRTCLISTLISYVMALQIVSLFLFIHTAEELHTLFTGAMCAAGTLNVNSYGYSALVVGVATAVACGLWLVVNRADSKGYDYPLIRAKYRLLIPVAGLIAFQGFLTWRYFTSLDPDLITSCCGTLFSEDARTVAGSLAAVPPGVAQAAFFLLLAAAVRVGLQTALTGRWAKALGWLSLAGFVVSIIAVVSFISVFYYELPTHHCPFCILQPEYGFIGYPLYAAILVAGISGMGAGVLEHYKGAASLAEALPRMQRRLAWASAAANLVLAAVAAYPLIFSSFKLKGY